MQYNDDNEPLTPDQPDGAMRSGNHTHSSDSPMQNALAQIRQVAAIRTLAMRGDQASVVSLTAALHDPAWYVRAAAAQALGKMRGRIPVDELVQAVSDEDESVRAAAVWALGQAGIDAPVEPLLTALRDPAWLVREAAELALDELNLQEFDAAPPQEVEQFHPSRSNRLVAEGNVKAPGRFSVRRFTEICLVAAVLMLLLASWILIAQRPRVGSPGPSIAPAPVIYRDFAGRVYGGVYKLAWSPDGKQIASVNADGSVLVWNASTGKTIDRYASPVSFVKVLSMVWLPQNYLLILSERVDNTIDAWNPITGSVFWSTVLQKSSSVGAWSPDGQRIAFDAGDHTIQVWNVFSQQKIATHAVQTQATITALAWSIEGTQIASATYDGSIQIWNAMTGRNASLSIENAGHIIALSWFSDGKRIALATSDGNVQIWNRTASGNTLRVLRHSTGSLTPFVALAWSPDGSSLAASDDAQVQIWNAVTGKQLMSYRGHTDSINDLKWSPDGTRIASASLDKTVQVWFVF